MQYIAFCMPVPTETIPIDRRSARHTVFERVRAWIVDGVLEPGEVIKDGDIAAQLGVSRTPVREALQMLERDGAVEMLPGRLTRVTNVAPENVAQLYAPLGALMATAVEIATPRASAGDLAAMREYNARLVAALEANDPVSAREADRGFHGVFLVLADNPYLATAIEPLLVHARRLETLYFRDAKPGRASYEEHNEIIAAVEAREARRAADVTRHNFTRFWTPRSRPDSALESGRSPK